jgi:hypothetical protein
VPFPTVVRAHVQRIEAAPERVFPLLCPVREREWLDGWECELLHSRSGLAEEGCVFRTRWDDFPETVWIVTLHDGETGRVEFARVTPGLVATRLLLRVEAAGAGTALHVLYAHTPLSAEGAAFVEKEYAPEAFERSMTWWERSMNHFLKTGRMLRKSEAA